MTEGFEAEVLAALAGLKAGQDELRADVRDVRSDLGGLREEVGGLREDVHRIDAALGMLRAEVRGVREDLADLRGEVVVATTLAAGAEARADATRDLLREVIKTQAAHGRRIGKIEDRERDRGGAKDE